MPTQDSYDQTAELYDHVVPYVNRKDIGFFVAEAVRSSGPVLELGCGTGRVLIPTARAGVEIVGVDLSSRMLDACRQKLAAEPDEVRRFAAVIHSDMRQVNAGRRFALVTTPFRSFQHLLTIDDQLACLQRVSEHLAPGGRFILDVFQPSLRLLIDENRVNEHAFEPEFEMPDGRRVVRSSRAPHTDFVNQVITVELIHRITHPTGICERIVHEFKLRYFFRWELEHLLARAGFQIEAVYGNYDRAACDAPGTNEIIIIATRAP